MFVFRNRCFKSSRKHVSLDLAKSQFEHARTRLLNVNNWSGLGWFTARFELYDPNLIHSSTLLEQGSYIKISFPFLLPESWVKVTEFYTDDTKAYFVVYPVSDPFANPTKTISHFLKPESSSIFKVQLEGLKISGYEIGRNERINNQAEQAGNRKLINTIMAWGGWLVMQNYQWDKLTKYFVKTETPLTML